MIQVYSTTRVKTQNANLTICTGHKGNKWYYAVSYTMKNMARRTQLEETEKSYDSPDEARRAGLYFAIDRLKYEPSRECKELVGELKKLT